MEVDCLEVFLQVFDGLGQEGLEGWRLNMQVLCYWDSWVVKVFILEGFLIKGEFGWEVKVDYGEKLFNNY